MDAATRINFEQGSSRYDSTAEYFRFDANDEHGAIRCSISREAFQRISGLTHVQAEMAPIVFNDWENSVFEVARGKYDRGEREIDGSITVRLADVNR